MFETIIASLTAIWAPSIMAILSVAATVCIPINKTKDAIKELKKDDVLKEISDKLSKVVKENRELQRCNKLLLDKITKIKDYADNVRNERDD